MVWYSSALLRKCLGANLLRIWLVTDSITMDILPVKIGRAGDHLPSYQLSD